MTNFPSDEYIRNFKNQIIGQLSTKRIARQFVLEELEGATQGNAYSRDFVKKSGFPEEAYKGTVTPVDIDDQIYRLCMICVGFSANFNNDEKIVPPILVSLLDEIMRKYELGKYRVRAELDDAEIEELKYWLEKLKTADPTGNKKHYIGRVQELLKASFKQINGILSSVKQYPLTEIVEKLLRATGNVRIISAEKKYSAQVTQDVSKATGFNDFVYNDPPWIQKMFANLQSNNIHAESVSLTDCSINKLTEVVPKKSHCSQGVFLDMESDLKAITEDQSGLVKMAYAYARRLAAAGLLLQGLIDWKCYTYVASIWSCMQQYTNTENFQKEAAKLAEYFVQSYDAQLTINRITGINSYVNIEGKTLSGGIGATYEGVLGFIDLTNSVWEFISATAGAKPENQQQSRSELTNDDHKIYSQKSQTENESIISPNLIKIGESILTKAPDCRCVRQMIIELLLDLSNYSTEDKSFVDQCGISEYVISESKKYCPSEIRQSTNSLLEFFYKETKNQSRTELRAVITYIMKKNGYGTFRCPSLKQENNAEIIYWENTLEALFFADDTLCSAYLRHKNDSEYPPAWKNKFSLIKYCLARLQDITNNSIEDLLHVAEMKARTRSKAKNSTATPKDAKTLLESVPKVFHTQQGLFWDIHSDLNAITKNHSLMIRVAYAYARRTVGAGMFLQGIIDWNMYKHISLVFQAIHSEKPTGKNFQEDAAAQAYLFLQSYDPQLTKQRIKVITSIVESEGNKLNLPPLSYEEVINFADFLIKKKVFTF